MLNKPKVPCKKCDVSAPERVSGMLQPKTELFRIGWHVHKSIYTSKRGPKESYTVFLDDALMKDWFEGLYHA